MFLLSSQHTPLQLFFPDVLVLLLNISGRGWPCAHGKLIHASDF